MSSSSLCLVSIQATWYMKACTNTHKTVAGRRKKTDRLRIKEENRLSPDFR